MGSRLLVGALVLLVLALAGGAALNRIETRARLESRAHVLTGGAPQAGKAAIARRPCGGCHEIPGVAGAAGKVGPSLKGFSGRVYIGGRQRNTPANLVAWIENPHTIDPQNVMPPMGIGDHEARDIAAYLYTLQ